LCEIKEKNVCCHNAFLYGIYTSSMKNGKMTFGSEAIAKIVNSRFAEIFGLELELEKKPKKCALKTENTDLLEKEYGFPCDRLNFGVAKCEGCLSAFVRGVFVGCGTMNDPKGSNHLEFVIEEPLADELLALLEDEAVTMKKTVRKGKTLLYCKSGEVIQDLLTYLGAMKDTLDMMEARITKEQMQYASRLSNFDYANIKKATVAASNHIEAIKILDSEGVLMRLSPELIETAKLRLVYPDATLEELRQKIEPPISKSGLNHRLKKLVEEAEAITGRETRK